MARSLYETWLPNLCLRLSCEGENGGGKEQSLLLHSRYRLFSYYICLNTGYQGSLRGPGLRHSSMLYANNDSKKKKNIYIYIYIYIL